MPGGASQPALFTGAFALVSLGLLVAGVAQLALGHLIGLVPTVAFPLPAAAMAGANATGSRSLEQDIAWIIREVNEVLGSAAVSPGSSASPAATGNDA